MFLVIKPSKITFNNRNIKQQAFKIRISLLAYILDTANAHLMSKLFKTCKLFYQMKPYCILEYMNIGRSVDFINKNVSLSFEKTQDLETYNNIWISKRLVLDGRLSKSILSKILRCTSVEFLFVKEALHITEYPQLLNHIQKWKSMTPITAGEDKHPVSLDELVSYLPSATSIT